MIILAQTTAPTHSELGLWISCLNAFLLLVGCIILGIKFLRNDSEKREVTISGDTVSKEEFNLHVADNKEDINHLHTKIGGSERGTKAELKKEIEDLRAERRADMDNLNGELRGVAKSIGELTASNQMQNQRLTDMDHKLDRLVERE